MNFDRTIWYVTPGRKRIRAAVMIGSLGSFLAVLNGTAQTNDPPPRAELFAFAGPQLHPELAEPVRPPVSPEVTSSVPVSLSPPADSGAVKLQITSAAVLDSGEGQYNFDRFVDAHPGLIVPPAPTAKDPVSRGFAAVLRPEPFHLGKTTVSCSVATAIKRRNPLCLLNPIFLNVSW